MSPERVQEERFGTKEHEERFWHLGHGVIGLAVLAGLYLASLHSYLLFHSLVEFFSIVVACGAFIIFWNSRRFLENSYFPFLGIALLAVAALDLVHALAYMGMGILAGEDADPPTQLWIAARGLEAISLLAAPLVLRRKLNAGMVLACYAAIVALVLVAIFHWDVFPHCFTEGVGLTAFKKISEYVICLLLVGALALHYRRRTAFDKNVFRLLALAILMTIGAELAFTLYVSAYGAANFTGHFLKLAAFYLIYRAIIEVSLRKPYDLLFRDLRRSEERYRDLVEMSPDAIFINRRNRLVYVNPAALQLFGVTSAEQLLGKSPFDLFHPDCHALVRRRIETLLAGEPVSRAEERILRLDGSVRDVEVVAAPITDREGPAIQVILRDTTNRIEAEQALRRAAEELARSNRDLEQFASAASHDLQEPLRTVTGYLQLLSRRYQGKLDEKADTFIGYAVDAAKRMSELIQDLLAYSRVNTRGEPLRETHAENVFDAALCNLRLAIEESGASITHDPLPVVRADKTQLGQLLQNLIGNAVKYRSPHRPVEIHVSARQDQGQWVFSVQDNGIGFEQQHEERLFLIFQRLHAKSQYPGTGVGLAICKRIVERHGGRIFATGEPDKGATFSFTLPMQANPSAD